MAARGGVRLPPSLEAITKRCRRDKVGRHGINVCGIDAKRPMAVDLLTSKEAARRLGVSVSQFYDWLRLSNVGELKLCGQAVTIEYFQGGPKGQGRIRIDATEVERLLELMRVRPRILPVRKPIVHRPVYPGITVELGRPGHAPAGQRAPGN